MSKQCQSPITKSQQQQKRKIDILSTPIHDRSLSGLGTGSSITCGGAKLDLRVQIFPLSEMRRSCTCFLHVRRIPILTYNWTNSIIIKNIIILNIIHNIFKCIMSSILVILCADIFFTRSTIKAYINIDY